MTDTTDPQTAADGQGEPAELRSLPPEVRRLVHAVDRMRDDWLESSPQRCDELMRRTYEACDAVWNRPLPAAPSVPADRAGLRERIAAALVEWTYRGKDPEHGGILETVRANAYSRADAALSVLPSAADRADVLREAADAVMRLDYMELRADFEYDSQRDAWDGGTIDAAHELRRMADVAQYGDDCEMAASWRRDGFGEDEIATMLRRGGDEEQQAETQAPCACAAAGDCFAPSGHYADCPQATPPAVVAEPGKEN